MLDTIPGWRLATLTAKYKASDTTGAGWITVRSSSGIRKRFAFDHGARDAFIAACQSFIGTGIVDWPAPDFVDRRGEAADGTQIVVVGWRTDAQGG